MRQRPFALIGAGAVIDAVVDAGIAQILVGAGEALLQFVRAEPFERSDELLPRRPRLARRIDHLVDDAVDRPVAVEQQGLWRLAPCFGLIPPCP